MTKEVGRKIGEVFNKVIEILIPNGGGKDGKLMKILVELDFNKPLFRGTTMKLNGNVRCIEF